MAETYDILILGAGPAGISAALTAKARGRTTAILSADPLNTPLAKAPRIENYPGVAAMNGRQLLAALLSSAIEQGVEIRTGRVTSAAALGGKFMVGQEQEIYEAKSLVLCLGSQQGTKPFPGEMEYLGKGVSWCATCDGMLYRGKRVAVLGLGSGAEKDAAFLKSIGCDVTYLAAAQAKDVEIIGAETVTALRCGGEEYAVDGVFILRDTVAADGLLPGLRMEEGHIAVGADMDTSIPGVYAAGDCTGRPYQIARAVGQGNVAALAADRYVKEREA